MMFNKLKLFNRTSDEILNCESKIIPEINLKELCILINLMKGIEKIKIRDDSIDFKLKGKNSQLVTIKQLLPGKFIAFSVFDIPKNKEEAALIATMIWNDDKIISHNTYAYITLKNVCVFESHLSIYSGTTTKYLQEWLNGFIDKIEPFTSTFTAIVNKYERKKADNGWRLLDAVVAVGYLGVEVLKVWKKTDE